MRVGWAKFQSSILNRPPRDGEGQTTNSLAMPEKTKNQTCVYCSGSALPRKGSPHSRVNASIWRCMACIATCLRSSLVDSSLQLLERAFGTSSSASGSVPFSADGVGTCWNAKRSSTRSSNDKLPATMACCEAKHFLGGDSFVQTLDLCHLVLLKMLKQSLVAEISNFLCRFRSLHS